MITHVTWAHSVTDTIVFVSCYHSAAAVVSELGWAVQAAGMEEEVPVLVLVAEAVRV